MTARKVEPVADVPLTSSRALRVAMTRAADTALGLSLTVQSVGEEFLPLDGLVEALPAEVMYTALERGGEVVGLLGIDGQIRAAAIEMQTMGTLAKGTHSDRPPTKTDVMLVAPLCRALLKEMAETTTGSELDGWINDITFGAVFESLRAASLAMEDAEFRLVRLSIDLNVADRHGEIFVALPNHQTVFLPPEVKPLDKSWGERLHASVSAAPACLTAVLHKMALPLGMVEQLEAGQVLPLRGASVGTVQLFSAGGTMVVEARLGQSNGKRAIRVERPPDLAMRDLPAPKTQEVTQAS